jgi:hypothetical protein
MEVTIWVVRIVVRAMMGLVVGVVIRAMVRAVARLVVRTVMGFVVGIMVRTVIGTFVRLVARVMRFFVRTIRIIVRIVIWAVMRLVVRIVVGVVRLVICFSEFQYAFAIFTIGVPWLESRVDARPLFIFTFCPSFVPEVIEVVSPTPNEFTCIYIVVLYLNPIDFSCSYVCISKRVQIVCFIESKDSHDEVLWLSEILNSVAVHTSHYFAINFVLHEVRSPLDFVPVEAFVVLNIALWFPRLA